METAFCWIGITYTIGFCVFLNKGWWVTHSIRKAIYCGLIWPWIVFWFIMES